MMVSFIVVAYNAEERLRGLLDDLGAQDYEHSKVEVILVDGDSNDGTAEVMREFACSHDFARVCVLRNPKRILACGWNIALKESQGDVILRVDAHSRIPSDFVRRNVEGLRKGEKIVGGRRVSLADSATPWSRVLLFAETSPFGSGIAKYRRSEEPMYVNTLAHAAYAREVFDAVGGYDERLVRTEDNEIHYRMKKAGFRFFLDPAIKSYHYARSTLSSMLRQKFYNGYWIGLTLGVSPGCFSMYHFAPLLFVLALSACIALFLSGTTIPLLLLLLLHLASSVAITLSSLRLHELSGHFLLLPVLFLLIHVLYGIGTVWGIVSLPRWLRRNAIIAANGVH